MDIPGNHPSWDPLEAFAQSGLAEAAVIPDAALGDLSERKVRIPKTTRMTMYPHISK